MAVQPVHQTREQILTQALGERVPVQLAGRYTLYRRSKSRTSLLIHDKRRGPESMPVATLTLQWGDWTLRDGDDDGDGDGESFSSQDPLEVFRWWLDRRERS